MEFKYPKSISIAHLPTPIEKLERLSKEWNGPNIYIKRDDMTGGAIAGNKIRKLEFSVAEAMAQNADLLITCGGIQSNHARATAVAACKMGISSLLVLRGDPNSEVDGNLLLDHLIGADFHFITADDYQNVNGIMEDLAQDLRKKGRRPYVIPEGASNAIGYFGYIRAAEEILTQIKDMSLMMDHILVATGSGGTLGGLLLGKHFFGLNSNIAGINVCDDGPHFQKRIHGVFQEMIETYGWDLEIAPESIPLIDGYVGEGYALSRQEELEFIAEVARLEGFILDPVYTGKAFFGMYDQIKKGHFKKGENILFIHTGGLFGLFPKRDQFSDLWKV